MNGITAQRAQEFDIPPQSDGESDMAFRTRVSGALRAAGHIIEAHEAYRDALYNDPDSGCMDGIIGAVAQIMQGVDYHSDGEHQVGDDIAAGLYVQHKHDDDSMMALLAVMLFGGR